MTRKVSKNGDRKIRKYPPSYHEIKEDLERRVNLSKLLYQEKNYI